MPRYISPPQVGCVSAIFKCPDGYNGGYPRQAKRGIDSNGVLDGYADFVDDGHRCNPFSNKIVLMDEVHNLIAPSDEILRNPRRMQLLRNLRQVRVRLSPNPDPNPNPNPSPNPNPNLDPHPNPKPG